MNKNKLFLPVFLLVPILMVSCASGSSGIKEINVATIYADGGSILIEGIQGNDELLKIYLERKISTNDLNDESNVKLYINSQIMEHGDSKEHEVLTLLHDWFINTNKGLSVKEYKQKYFESLDSGTESNNSIVVISLIEYVCLLRKEALSGYSNLCENYIYE